LSTVGLLFRSGVVVHWLVTTTHPSPGESTHVTYRSIVNVVFPLVLSSSWWISAGLVFAEMMDSAPSGPDPSGSKVRGGPSVTQ
jgi:hypothetical protein